MNASHASFELVALAASAGGLQAFLEIISHLPADFPAAVVVVQHLSPKHRSLMPEILSRVSNLAVKQAEEGDRLNPGTVYVAPSDRYLLVNADGSLSLQPLESDRTISTSADVMFESVSRSYQNRAIAVILTGTGHDGAKGAREIEKMGGMVIAQDEKTSQFFGMPGTAIEMGTVDLILPLSEIAPTLVKLTMEGKENGERVSHANK